MAWLVKNTTPGNVFLNDVKLMFAPGEEIDVELCVAIRKYGGSSDLMKMLNKGLLQTMHKDPDSKLAEEMNLQIVIEDKKSVPQVQSLPPQPAMDHDELKAIIREALAEKKDVDIVDVVRDVILSLINEVRATSAGAQPMPGMEVVTPCIIPDLDADALVARIHGARVDDGASDISGEIVVTKEEKAQGNVADLVTALKAIKSESGE